jgi:hypothetical protein
MESQEHQRDDADTISMPDGHSGGIKNTEDPDVEVPSGHRDYSYYIDKIFSRSPLLITVLYIVIIYSIITLIVLLIFILINRTKIEKEKQIRDILSEEFQRLIMDYLFYPDRREEIVRELTGIATNDFKRQILVNQLIDLSVNMKGEISEAIKELYLKLGLKNDSLERVRSKKWHKNIKGFRELAFMNIREANEKIIECLNSPNEILRMEAQIALVRLSDENPYHFLDLMEKPFSLWEQITLHELVTQHNIDVPEFSQWFDSENISVMIFALQMASWFKQKNAEKGIIKLLEHPDENVRHTAIKVCGDLELQHALPHLKSMYEGESFKNRLEILISFSKVPREEYLDFLKSTLDKEEDVTLQINATKAMENTGEPGISMLIKLMKSKSEYRNYQIIIRHVLDGRIY